MVEYVWWALDVTFDLDYTLIDAICSKGSVFVVGVKIKATVGQNLMTVLKSVIFESHWKDGLADVVCDCWSVVVTVDKIKEIYLLIDFQNQPYNNNNVSTSSPRVAKYESPLRGNFTTPSPSRSTQK